MMFMIQTKFTSQNIAGSSGYDLVVPTADFLARGLEAGALTMDLSRLQMSATRTQPFRARQMAWSAAMMLVLFICGVPQVLRITQ